MKEILDLSFSGPMVFPTALLLFVGLYWVVFLIGLIDLSFLDFDLDVDKDIGIEIDLDADVDVDVDVDSDVDADSQGGPGLGVNILRFLNLDAVPFMVFTSFFALFFWAGSLIAIHEAGGNLGIVLGLMVAAAIGAALLTKLVTQPFKGFFRSLNDEEKPIQFRGRICVLELGVEGNRLGQADLMVDGKSILLNVLSETGDKVKRGTQCVIVDYVADRDAYTVHPFQTEGI